MPSPPAGPRSRCQGAAEGRAQRSSPFELVWAALYTGGASGSAPVYPLAKASEEVLLRSLSPNGGSGPAQLARGSAGGYPAGVGVCFGVAYRLGLTCNHMGLLERVCVRKRLWRTLRVLTGHLVLSGARPYGCFCRSRPFFCAAAREDTCAASGPAPASPTAAGHTPGRERAGCPRSRAPAHLAQIRQFAGRSTKVLCGKTPRRRPRAPSQHGRISHDV